MHAGIDPAPSLIISGLTNDPKYTGSLTLLSLVLPLVERLGNGRHHKVLEVGDVHGQRPHQRGLCVLACLLSSFPAGIYEHLITCHKVATRGTTRGCFPPPIKEGGLLGSI